MLQVDRVDNRAISEKTIQFLGDAIEGCGGEVVVFSDFRHGIFNSYTIAPLKKRIPKDMLRVADSQVSSRWGNILDFRDFDLITPNEREARFALGNQDLVIRNLAMELYKKSGSRYLILKLGERGLITYRSPGPNPREFFTVDSFANDVIDPTGAGDGLLAYSSLALKATGNIVIATILGNLAGGLVCEKQGNAPITIDEVERRISDLEKWSTFK